MNKTIVVSVSVNKGGCGKSTISANLTYALAKMDKKILLIDTDAQMNATSAYGLSANEKNFYNAFKKEEDILNHIIKTKYPNIDFVVSDKAMSTMELQMSYMLGREHRMKNILKSVVDSNYYDFIIIDTSSDLGMVNTSILHAVDYVLIPIEPASFTLKGMQDFLQHFNQIKINSKNHYNKEIKIIGAVMNKFKKIENLSKDSYELARNVFSEYLMDTILRNDTNIGNAQLASIPIGEYDTNTAGTKDIKKLAEEVIQIVSKER
jgi:chromosome partitioning protein